MVATALCVAARSECACLGRAGPGWAECLLLAWPGLAATDEPLVPSDARLLLVMHQMDKMRLVAKVRAGREMLDSGRKPNRSSRFPGLVL